MRIATWFGLAAMVLSSCASDSDEPPIPCEPPDALLVQRDALIRRFNEVWKQMRDLEDRAKTLEQSGEVKDAELWRERAQRNHEAAEELKGEIRSLEDYLRANYRWSVEFE